MKNLKILYAIEEKFDSLNCPKFLTLNSENRTGEIYVTTSHNLLALNLQKRSSRILASVLGACSCEYLSLNNEIILACEAGEVFVYKPLTNQLEEVTYCDGGIEMMCLSPDQEIIVFITKQQTVVLMNSTYDVITECSLSEEFFGEDEFVNVGWGECLILVPLFRLLHPTLF